MIDEANRIERLRALSSVGLVFPKMFCRRRTIMSNSLKFIQVRCKEATPPVLRWKVGVGAKILAAGGCRWTNNIPIESIESSPAESAPARLLGAG